MTTNEMIATILIKFFVLRNAMVFSSRLKSENRRIAVILTMPTRDMAQMQENVKIDFQRFDLVKVKPRTIKIAKNAGSRFNPVARMARDPASKFHAVHSVPSKPFMQVEKKKSLKSIWSMYHEMN